MYIQDLNLKLLMKLKNWHLMVVWWLVGMRKKKYFLC